MHSVASALGSYQCVVAERQQSNEALSKIMQSTAALPNKHIFKISLCFVIHSDQKTAERTSSLWNMNIHTCQSSISKRKGRW